MRKYQKHPMRRRRRLLAFALSLCMAAAALPIPAAADETTQTVLPETGDGWRGATASKFSSGEGTEESPYMISNGDELALLASKVNSTDVADAGYRSAYYKLKQDINLNNQSWTPIGTGSGSREYAFTGHFDGDGRTISGLNVSGDYMDSGLFGYCEGAQISNLTVTGTTTVGSVTSAIAIICAWAKNTTFTDCHSAGTVQSTFVENLSLAAGGICGGAYGSSVFTGCSNAASVQLSDAADNKIQAGGICGSVENNVSVTGCSNTGAVTTTNCSDSAVGGVAGLCKGVVTACSNTAAISSQAFAGGICGVAQEGSITGSCSTGTVSGKTVGGIAGIAEGTVTGCVYQKGCITDSGASVAEAGTSMTTAQIAGGAAAYLMNQTLGDTAAYQWRQRLGEGGASVPTIQKSAVTDNTVYPCTGCTGKYSNTENQPAEHSGYSYAAAEGSADTMQVKCGDCGTEFGTVKLSFDTASRAVTAVMDISDATVQAAVKNAVETAGIKYYAADADGQKTGDALAGAPMAGGSYAAELTLTGADEEAAVISLSYTLERVKPTVTTPPTLSGVYGTKVSEMTLTDGEAQVNETPVAGTWSVTDTAKDDYPTVGTTTAYVVTFTPADTAAYDPVTVKVVPNVTKKPATYASRTLPARSYGAAQGGTDSVDLSLYVPADGGAATYGPVSVGGDPVTDAKVTEQGVLSYTVTGGAVGAKTNVAVTVQTENYESFTITVPVELAAEAPAKLTQMEAVNGSVTNTTATVRLTADKEGVTYYLYYTTDASVIVDANTVKGGSSNTTGSFALSGLTRNTTYYVYAAAADANGTLGNIRVMQLTTANEDPKPSGGSGSSSGGSGSSGESSSGGTQPAAPADGGESGKDTGKDNEKENESREPQIKDENGESKKSGWDAIREEVKSAKSGETVTVQMNGALTVPGKTLKSLKGKDVNVTFELNHKISLTINGSDLSGFTFKNKNDYSVLFLWTVTGMSRMMRSIGA